MKKNICTFLLLCILISSVFCRPGPLINLRIDNYTQQNVFIEYKLLNGNIEKERNYFWTQEINEQLITIHDTLFNRSIAKIRPNYKISIIEYYSTGKLTDLVERFKGIRPIPLMTLLKSTYKELKIYTENGSRIITLDTLENENIMKYDNGESIGYILEIYEQDDSKE
ncbi:MAG TPA: hypothetical protein PLR39_09420 [Treponemataceae bacterium]|nr:hypothetical protein [Treponemataceae bacterium]